MSRFLMFAFAVLVCLLKDEFTVFAGSESNRPTSSESASTNDQSSPEKRPNIVFMISDDQGWNGLSVAMHPDYAGSRSEIHQTPNLERLVSQGMRFSAAYAPAPVCSPTRISLQTGKSPAALHWTKAAPPVEGQRLIEPRNIRQLPPSETTIADLLRSAGYATAHYGKWHIGGGGPEANGYDESDGDTGNENASKFSDPNPVDIFGMAERAADFMQRSQHAGQPFFIQLSWNALHAAENANRATLQKYAARLGNAQSKQVAVAAITEDLDTGVGRVLESIDRLGLADNTFVIYTSDNGAGGGGGARSGGARRALNGGKGDVYEGGIRVPFIIRGPGIEPNSWCHTPIVGYDLFPTFCEWAQVPASNIPRDIEGGSLLGLLATAGEAEVQRKREGLVFHFPHYQGDSPHTAFLLGNFKLIHFYENDRDVLFDLSTDIRESRDLAASMPEETQMLRERLKKYLVEIDAQLPTPNPEFNPGAQPQPQQGNQPGGGGGRNRRK